MRSLLFLTLAAALSAQTVSRPPAGIVLDPNGDLRSVQGIFSNLLPAAPVWTLAAQSKPPYLAAAFSDSGGAVKTGERVLVTDGSARFLFSLSAPAGPALFNFGTDGAPRFAYYPLTAQYEDLDSGAVLDAHPSGDEVLALGKSSGEEFTVLARHGSQLVIETVLTDGSVAGRVNVQGSGPAAAFEGGWLVSSGDGLKWVTSDGTAMREIALPEKAQSLQAAGTHAVAINGKWLLTSRWDVLQIPVLKRADSRFRETWK